MTPEEVDEKNIELMRAYRRTFGTPHGQVVLQDLMKFCGFRVPIEANGEFSLAIGEGKRQAFLRVMHFIAFAPEQIRTLMRGQHITMQEDDDA